MVDDNADAAAMVAILLRAIGHSVEVAHDGPGALRVAESFRPELAILDLNMPAMDGQVVAESLRSSYGSSIRIVALTGALVLTPEQRAAFDVCLAKPATLDDLHRAMSGSCQGDPPTG